MANFEFIKASGGWDIAANWFDTSTSKIATSPPGAADSAWLEGALVITGNETVENVYGATSGVTATLKGGGLTVTGVFTGVTLLTGKYSAGFFFGVLKGAQLSGNHIGGTTAGQGGATIVSGTVTKANTFWGDIQGGSVTTQVALLAYVAAGATLTANTIALDGMSGGEISETGGTITTSSLTAYGGPVGGGAVISGGVFTDSGGLSIRGRSATGYGIFNVTGGAASVGGAANIANFGSLAVNGKGDLQLMKGLTLAAAAASQSRLWVGSPVAANGTLTVTGGSVVLGNLGAATVNLTNGGVFDASTCEVVVGLGASSASSTVTDAGGFLSAKTLIVGYEGSGSLAIIGGGVTVGGPLWVGARSGAKGVVSLANKGSGLMCGQVVVGGTPTAQGGSGTITIGKGADANFLSTTIWKSGVIDDGGSLAIEGSLAGNGTLKLEQGAQALVSADAAASAAIQFNGAAELILSSPASFHSTITHVVAGDVIHASGFGGTTMTFHESGTGTLGIVSLVGSGSHFLFAQFRFAGAFTASDFAWDAGTLDLTFK